MPIQVNNLAEALTRYTVQVIDEVWIEDDNGDVMPEQVCIYLGSFPSEQTAVQDYENKIAYFQTNPPAYETTVILRHPGSGVIESETLSNKS